MNVEIHTIHKANINIANYRRNVDKQNDFFRRYSTTEGSQYIVHILLVVIVTLVLLAAGNHRVCRVRAEVTYMSKRAAPFGLAGSYRFDAFPHVPQVANVIKE